MQIKPILDACCGSRMFHFDKQNPHVLFADNRQIETTMKDRDKIRHLEVKPDVIHDFTAMPYEDETFWHVVFDPPHLVQGGENSWLVKKYGKLPCNWREVLKKGFDECMRVLKPNGTLIFKWNETQIPVSDVLVGGTPCQAFSVAGKRESLDDDRGNLTLTLIHILEAIDYVRQQNGQPPCILVWENVPGVLSTKDNAFGHFLAGLVQEREPLQPAGGKWTNAGYVHSARTVAWRVLDAQHFGVAQRRKRVFLVASARARSVAQILIEPKGMRGDIETRGSEGKNLASFAESSFGTYRQSDISSTLKARGGVLDGGSETLIVHGTQDPIISQNKAHCLGRNNGQENVLFEVKGAEAVRVSEIQDKTPTLKARMGTGGNNIPCIALAGNTIGRQPENGGNGNGFDESGVSYTLTRTDVHAVSTGTTIRKLTPIECERLQGFSDDWTKIPYRGKSAEECPDSPRYKAIGNSMCINVMEWIGQRLNDYLTQSL